MRVVLKSDRETTGEVQLVVPDGDGVPSTIREPADAPRLLRADTEAVVELSRALGKKPVVIGDRAGFVAIYLLFGYFAEGRARRAVIRAVASASERALAEGVST